MAIALPNLDPLVDLTRKVATMQVPVYWNIDITVIGAVKDDAVQVVSALRPRVPMKLTMTALEIADTWNPALMRGSMRGLVIITDRLALSSSAIKSLTMSLFTVRTYVQSTFNTQESLLVDLDGKDFLKSNNCKG